MALLCGVRWKVINKMIKGNDKLLRILKYFFLTTFFISLNIAIGLILLLVGNLDFEYIFLFAFPFLIVTLDIFAVLEERLINKSSNKRISKNIILSWLPFLLLATVFIIIKKYLGSISFLKQEDNPSLLLAIYLFITTVILLIEIKKINNISGAKLLIPSLFWFFLLIPVPLPLTIILSNFFEISSRFVDFLLYLSFSGFFILINKKVENFSLFMKI